MLPSTLGICFWGDLAINSFFPLTLKSSPPGSGHQIPTHAKIRRYLCALLHSPDTITSFPHSPHAVSYGSAWKSLQQSLPPAVVPGGGVPLSPGLLCVCGPQTQFLCTFPGPCFCWMRKFHTWIKALMSLGRIGNWSSDSRRLLGAEGWKVSGFTPWAFGFLVCKIVFFWSVALILGPWRYLSSECVFLLFSC